MADKKSKLAVIKTKPTTESVHDFINALKDEQQRKDSFELLEIMKRQQVKSLYYGAVRS